MNRTALCIKMLNILSIGILVSREELASRLETNKRNISEYKKELETAGYLIESRAGKFGGYYMNKENHMPQLNLNNSELQGVYTALQFLNQYDIPNKLDIVNGLEKVLNSYTNKNLDDTIFKSNNPKLDGDELNMVSILNNASKHHLQVSFEYKGVKDENYKIRFADVYKIISIENYWYLIGYDRDKYSYRNYRISSNRMKNIVLGSEFKYDNSFNVNDEIGKSSIFKDVHKIKFEIYGNKAKVYNDMNYGNNVTKTYKNKVLYLDGVMENKYDIEKFVYSLGSSIKVIEPVWLIEEIKKENELIKNLYE